MQRANRILPFYPNKTKTTDFKYLEVKKKKKQLKTAIESNRKRNSLMITELLSLELTTVLLVKSNKEISDKAPLGHSERRCSASRKGSEPWVSAGTRIFLFSLYHHCLL